MGFKREIFDTVFDGMISALQLNRANKLTCNITQKISPVFRQNRNGEKYLFTCPNDLTRWRAETFFAKEPETLEWIDGFAKDDVLFDVGANVGLYSIYAAKRGIRVCSFEPESQNYALLNRNIFLNGLVDKVTALNIALADKDGMDYLYLPNFEAGAALNNLGEAIDFQHKAFKPSFKQAVMAYTLDTFLKHNPGFFPNHIKVDVDGIEPKVIRGAEQTLRDPRVKSLLIEINEALPEDVELCKEIEKLGFRFSLKKECGLEGGNPEFKSILNYIFVKK